MNWVADQIGKPHDRLNDSDGPDKYSCWGLVRAAVRNIFCVELPPVAVNNPDESQVRAIKHAARVSHWRPVDGQRMHGDIVLMRNRQFIHCGLVLNANGHLGVLHASHGRGVVFEKWQDATEGMTPELWRKQNAN